MRQTLTLRMGQQLTMTPALQQAIRLVGLSSLELSTEIRTAIESNPMLEYDDETGTGDLLDGTEDSEAVSDDDWDDTDYEDASFDDSALDGASFEDVAAASDDDPRAPGTDEAGSDALADTEGTEFDQAGERPAAEEAIEASDWSADETRFERDAPAAPDSRTQGPRGEGDTPIEERSAPAETLHDYLAWQLNLTRLSEADQRIGVAIIDALNDDGMLTEPLQDIAGSAGCNATLADAERVLKEVQRFDPPGVAARDLAECLALQLQQLPVETPWRSEALDIVQEHFDVLAAQDLRGLARRTRLEGNDLAAAIALVRSLNPRPGAAMGDSEADYVEPDVVVRKARNTWIVELNDQAAPRVRLNEHYASLVRRSDTSRDNQFLKSNLQEARFFLKSIENRNDTLLRVAANIVECQAEFLERGEEAMRPLVLADVAEAVGLHESTVSRATARKYMRTPRGVFELKYFFSSHVGTADGGEISSTAIRALIRKLTERENPCQPLSDSRIAALLGERDIKVARRTVAKYRESLAIPSSNERKRMAWADAGPRG
ncbi:MAG: RNA polymerase factor sigma-54 [Gammaproteobacteria bacterium]|nr:RNA polymerase factor sigma-54 [Gammaproteobacteria bacterium]